MQIEQVSQFIWETEYNKNYKSSKLIREYCTPPFQIVTRRTYMTRDRKSGFMIKEDGELCCLHSTVKGRGVRLLLHAVSLGANKLDFFDSQKLYKLYSKFGFKEYKRETNWVKYAPDIVYMRLG